MSAPTAPQDSVENQLLISPPPQAATDEPATEKSCAGDVRVVLGQRKAGRLDGLCHLLSGLRREGQSFGGPAFGELSSVRGQRQA